MGLLTGKTAIVTGAARGIGKAIALKFASEGANIAFTDLVIDENGQNTEKEIAALGVNDIREILLDLKKQGRLVILASHIHEDIEILCDEVVKIEAGKVSIM